MNDMARVADIAKQRSDRFRKSGEPPQWWRAAMVIGGVFLGVIFFSEFMAGPSEEKTTEPADEIPVLSVPTTTLEPTSTADTQLNPTTTSAPTTSPTIEPTDPAATAPPTTDQPEEPVEEVRVPVTTPPTTVAVGADVVTLLGVGSVPTEVPRQAWESAVGAATAAQPGSAVTGGVVTALNSETASFVLTGVFGTEAFQTRVQVTKDGDDWIAAIS